MGWPSIDRHSVKRVKSATEVIHEQTGKIKKVTQPLSSIRMRHLSWLNGSGFRRQPNNSVCMIRSCMVGALKPGLTNNVVRWSRGGPLKMLS